MYALPFDSFSSLAPAAATYHSSAMKLLSHIRTLSSTPLLPQKQESTSVLPSFPPTRVITYRLRRRHVALLVIGALSFGLAVVHLATSTTPMTRPQTYADTNTPLAVDETTTNYTSVESTAPPKSFNNATAPSYSPLVLGPPTQRFRENLRSDKKYITSWYGAGWNNDVITMMNLIYLAKITDRIPIIPTFTPSWHIGGDAPGIAFGEIFDVRRFANETGVEMLEWRDVKDPRSEEVEELGCWSVWQAVQKDENHPRDSDAPKWLKLDIAYTKAPEWIQILPDIPHDKGASFWSLARLAYPYDRQLNLRDDVLPSPLHGAVVDPDEQLLCYDYLYYVGSHQWFELEYEYGPAWREIGKHLHWTEGIESLAAQYVNRALGLPVGHSPPPYITVHVRHGDFGEWCWDAERFEDCFAPLSAVARRVQEVRDEVLERHGIDVPMKHVIMTSDETNEAWWDEVASYGWKRIDHAGQRTAERYSRWHPLVIDSAIQSNGLGFVGTDRSTFSILSRRRVADWRSGSTRMVLWGKKGADDH